MSMSKNKVSKTGGKLERLIQLSTSITELQLIAMLLLLFFFFKKHRKNWVLKKICNFVTWFKKKNLC